MTKHVLMNDGKGLGILLRNVEKLQQLNAIFCQYLEKNTAKHCAIASIKNDCLIVMTDNANWATQLRFQIPVLLQKLKQHELFKDIKAICCKTHPANQIKPISKHKTRKMKKLTPEVAKIILQETAQIEDPKLVKIMQRIALKTSS